MVQVDIEARLMAARTERELAVRRANRLGAHRATVAARPCPERPERRLFPVLRARPADC
jgi:hypothetical protein